jgi:hypothetical protein
MNIAGKSMTISAANGSIKTVTKSQVITIDELAKIKEVRSIGGTSCRTIV